MVALVSVERVKYALRIDHTDDDTLLEEVYIPAASAAVISHLKGQAEVLLDLDSDGDLPSGAEVPAAIEAATILLVGHFLAHPDEDPDKAFEEGQLPRPVRALLHPLRDPALA